MALNIEFFWACFHEDFLKAEDLISKGADVDCKFHMAKTALHRILDSPGLNYSSILRISTFLLSSGADINSKDLNGCKPIHYAMSRSPEIISFLISQGADIEAEDYEGLRPLHHAIEFTNVEAVEFLIQEGVDVSAKDKCGFDAESYLDRNFHFILPDDREHMRAILRS